jgi:hypothetical protein
MKNRKLLILSISTGWLLSMVLLLTSGAHGGKQPFINSLPVNIESIQESDSFFSVYAEYPQFETAEPDFNAELS